MTKKFTEEQYQKIFELFEETDDEYNMGLLNPNVVMFFQGKLHKEFGNVMYFIDDWQPITTFANPLTRELAHDKFVEKEKKYVWTSKKANSSGRHKRLFWQMSSKSVRDYFTVDEKSFDGSEHLTESEIKAWGYNPEMFDKEEVQ